MPETVSLGLPLLVAQQAQKHVTHNEALRALDAIVQLSVKDRDLAAPPGSPAEGDRYIVAASPTGVWAGHAADIAVWQDGAWDFHDPREGWRCWVDDENVFLIFAASAWVDWGAALGALQNLALLGIGTTADATNPFSAKLNKALWTAKTAAEGGDGDLRYTMNKEATSDVLSLLLQKGFSGRAEIGLIGDDNLTVKVSPDGSAFVVALVLDKTTGAAKFVAGSAASPGVQIGDADTGLYHTAAQLHAALDGAEALRITATGVAFGAGFDPVEILDVRRTGATLCRAVLFGENGVGYIGARHSGDASGPTSVFRKARGTLAASAAPNSGDEIGRFVFQGYASGAVPAASYAAVGQFAVNVIAGTPSGSDMEGRYVLSLSPAGSVSASEIMRLDHASGLSMFGANPVVDASRHLCLRSYTVATLPSAATAARMIYVSDGTSNKRLAVSDGTNWRFPDGNIVS